MVISSLLLITTSQLCFGLFIALCVILGFSKANAQQKEEPIKVVEFSGKVVFEDDKGNPAPLPYTNVAVKGTSRGAYTVSMMDFLR